MYSALTYCLGGSRESCWCWTFRSDKLSHILDDRHVQIVLMNIFFLPRSLFLHTLSLTQIDPHFTRITLQQLLGQLTKIGPKCLSRWREFGPNVSQDCKNWPKCVTRWPKDPTPLLPLLVALQANEQPPIYRLVLCLKAVVKTVNLCLQSSFENRCRRPKISSRREQ